MAGIARALYDAVTSTPGKVHRRFRGPGENAGPPEWRGLYKPPNQYICKLAFVYLMQVWGFTDGEPRYKTGITSRPIECNDGHYDNIRDTETIALLGPKSPIVLSTIFAIRTDVPVHPEHFTHGGASNITDIGNMSSEQLS